MKTFVLALVLGLVASFSMCDTAEAGCHRGGCRHRVVARGCCHRSVTVVRHRHCGSGHCGNGVCN